jgi:Protein of unknown function (DUF3159)
MKDKLRELLEEFKTVFAGRSNVADSIIPPVIFLIVNSVWGLEYAMWVSLAIAVAITVLRLSRRQPLRYAAGGLGGVVLAIVVAQLMGKTKGYFVPQLITGGLTVMICIVSVVAGRPLVAWTSYIARGWPSEWYLHPQVRPAYNEVTLGWAAFFAARLTMQFVLFQGARPETLAIVNTIAGWPATIVLLVLSYLYGLWRLQRLQGPSTEEFKVGAPPPWKGQRRGF